MNNSKSNKFVALYCIPASVLADWAKTNPETRKAEEEKMKAEWQKWMEEHAQMITLTEACGKTKRITQSGISDFKNDICLYAFIEAESHEAAAKIFENHPHLKIPNSSIEVMAVRAM